MLHSSNDTSKYRCDLGSVLEIGFSYKAIERLGMSLHCESKNSVPPYHAAQIVGYVTLRIQMETFMNFGFLEETFGDLVF